MINRGMTCLLTLFVAQTSPAHAASPVNVSVPSGTATMQKLGASRDLLKVPKQLTQAHRDREFVVARTPPSVDFSLLPMQDSVPGADNWLFSSWGDIEFGSDGNFYVAMGDHQARPGHAWVYQVNPASKAIKTVVDVTKMLKPAAGQYSPGKIHAPMINIGEYLYFIPYRGAKVYCNTQYGFRGEHLMRYHYETGLTEDLGIPVPNCSVAQMNYHAASNKLYLVGAWCPAQKKPLMSRFAVYDISTQKVVFQSGIENEPYASLRCMMVAPDGRVWYMSGKINPDTTVRYPEMYSGRYALYDPETNKAALTSLTPPAGAADGRSDIRAASEPDDNGIVWCISKGRGAPNPLYGAIYSFDTNTGRFGKNLGHCFSHGSGKLAISLYTALAKLDPTKTKLYYIPSAHGGASRHGAALIQYDVKTGTRKVVAFLFDQVKSRTGYSLGGTYGLAISRDGGQVCVNWMDEREGRKEVERRTAVTVVHIPESER